MSAKKANELREMTAEELRVHLRNLRDEHLHLRIKKSLGQIEQFHRFKEIRREIARTITILKQKEAEE